MQWRAQCARGTSTPVFNAQPSGLPQISPRSPLHWPQAQVLTCLGGWDLMRSRINAPPGSRGSFLGSLDGQVLSWDKAARSLSGFHTPVGDSI